MFKIHRILLFVVFLSVLLLFIVVASVPSDKFKIVACDVGQGDAILAYYKNTQILIDAGKNDSVLKCLNRHIPFWDREIELMMITHPQIDHFGGAIDFLKHYKLKNLLINSLDSGSQAYGALKNEVGGSGINIINPQDVGSIGLGMIHLDILFPTAEFVAQNSTAESSYSIDNVLGTYTSVLDPNDFSIVAILSFKEFDTLLTGDTSPEVTDEILATGKLKNVEYIKVPHHGSKNGLTQELLEITNPEIAVISVGKNSYGHPHQEVLDMLNNRGIKILRTDESGDVVIESDGKSWWVVN